jgi:hypothetical protein
VLTNASSAQAGYIYPVVDKPYAVLNPYVKSVKPKTAKPGATIKVTLGIRNDGGANGKVRCKGREGPGLAGAPQATASRLGTAAVA